MRLKILAAVLLVCAGILPAQTSSILSFVPPPPSRAVDAAFLGRKLAAGSFMWMLTIQQVGREVYADAGFPHLERWLEDVVDLNPGLLLPYHLGTVMLIADRDRSLAMDGILERGEKVHPTVWEFPMLRGVGAYFGQLDQVSAASHFHRAAAFPEAPPYFGMLADRLDRNVSSCGTLLNDLKAVAQSSGFASQHQRNVTAVMTECIQRELEQAAASYRFNEGHAAPSVEALLEKGFIQRAPPSPEGQCWVLTGADAELRPCR